MAVFIKATYVKKLGLPQYSSHQYSVEVSAELTDLAQLPQACADLYSRLQAAVDTQIVNPGFVPGGANEHTPASRPATPSGSNSGTGGSDDEPWKCSERQRDLIIKIVNEHQLDKAQVDDLARQRYGVGVKQLNKLQASGLIDELLETHGSAGSGKGRGQTQGQGERRGQSRAAYAGRGRQ
jgi:hypothetical protein